MFRNLLVAATLLSFNAANAEEIIAQKPIVCDLIEENKKIPETYNEIILFQAKNMSLDGYGGISIQLATSSNSSMIEYVPSLRFI